MIPDAERWNYETFRDCLSEPILRQLSVRSTRKSRRKRTRRSQIAPVVLEDVAPVTEDVEQNEAEELGDFIEYLASEIFTSLPHDLRVLSYRAIQISTSLAALYVDPLPPTTLDTLISAIPPHIIDSLAAYSLLLSDDLTSLAAFLCTPLTSYIAAVTAPPPSTATSKPLDGACELCERDWVPLTYHHLVPRAVHDKARRRGWYANGELNKVAWLSRACHSFVHRIASNEELAREWASVERLCEREDVKAWVAWVGRVRWKAR